MRQISIRQFQQHFHKELASLPFQVTKHGVPYFNVTTCEDVTTEVTTEKEDVTTSKVINTPEDVPGIMTAAQVRNMCEHGSMKGLCKFGCE